MGATVPQLSPASCYSSSDGVFTTYTWGGTAPYTYLWSDGGTSKDRFDLPRGVHTVTITDAAGCTSQMTQWIGSAANILISTSSNDPTSATANDGDATAIPSAGVAPYSYLWSDGQLSQTATGLGQGLYSVVVTDNNGCSNTAWIYVGAGTSSRVLTDVAVFEYNLYPNPSTGFFTLEVDAPIDLDRVQFSLINIIGKQILTDSKALRIGKNMFDYDISELEAGVYFLQIQSEDLRKTIRIVKN